MNTIFNKKINNIDDAKFFIEVLVTNEFSFHFEDDAHDIINGYDREKTFSYDDANSINDRLNEVYNLDWSSEGCECPIGYELDCLTALGLWDNEDILNCNYKKGV